MTNKKIIIFGCQGMIASHFLKQDIDNIFLVSSSLPNSDALIDLSNFNNSQLGFISKGDVIFFTSAISSPNSCKDNYSSSHLINVDGTKRVIEYALKKKAKVVFFSSDTVYGNSTDPKREIDELNPIGNYAKMKCEVEHLFKKNPLFLSLRLSYVVSGNDNFTKYIYDSIKNNRKIEIFHPILRNCIWIGDVIRVMRKLVSAWPYDYDSINLGGDELYSRFDLFKLIIKSLNIDPGYEIMYPGQDFYSERPEVISINNDRLNMYLGDNLTPLCEALVSTNL